MMTMNAAIQTPCSRRLLTVTAVAERLNVPILRVYKEIERGNLPAYRFGGRTLRVAEDELDRWVERHATVLGGVR